MLMSDLCCKSNHIVRAIMRAKRCSIRSHASGSTAGSDIGHTTIPKTSNVVGAGRIAFVLCLVTTAVVLGFLANFSITRTEEGLATAQYDALAEQYDSIADRALVAAQGINLFKRLGTISLSTILSYSLPDADAWPFVTLPGYENITANLIETSSGREMAFAPLVTPDQLSDFEDFAYDFFENRHDPPFPKGTGESSFGKGIWGLDLNLNTSDHRYRITNATPSYDSPNRMYFPILQHSNGSDPALMLNLRFEELRGRTIDRIIECAQLRVESGDLLECGAITPFLYLATQDLSLGPGALFLQPIFPANNVSTVSVVSSQRTVWHHSQALTFPSCSPTTADRNTRVDYSVE